MSIVSFFKKTFGKDAETYADIGEKGTEGAGKRAIDNKSGIPKFRYSYNGSIGGDNFSYELCAGDGNYVFEYRSMQYDDRGVMSVNVQKDVFDRLEKLYLSLRLAGWDGYSKYNPEVCDGSGFSLSIDFNDGGRMSADGTNAFPRGYAEFCRQMSEILDPLRDKALEEARNRIITEGIKGDVDHVLAFFKQQGDSGDDSYKFMLFRQSVREKNFEAEIDSERGGVFPKGKFTVYRTVPDEDLPFAGIKELVEKYDVIKWYDHHSSDPDYANKEWFQLCIHFDGGLYINAKGTAYPPNYEPFRRDFLRLMKKSVDSLKGAEALRSENAAQEK